MSQQLVKKGTNGRYDKVMPKSWIEAIKDKNTGQTLVEILQGFNMYFLPYNGNTSATRCLVPTMLRKKGLWITYVKYDGNVYTEWYAADKIDDKSWGDSSNWRIGNNTLVGDITISANGNWVINGTETEFKAVGEKGNTPLIRVANNRLQVSYDLGDTYRDVTNNPVYTKFRWLATTGDTQADNVGRIQASTNEGKTWTNMSNDFTNNLHISKYIGVSESLPTSGIAEGTIYAKGPYYDEGDTSNSNPIYRLWVYAWKGDTLAWQDNGEFTSIAAGVVQETGDSETEVMSQKAVTTKFSELGSELISKSDRLLTGEFAPHSFIQSNITKGIFVNNDGIEISKEDIWATDFIPVSYNEVYSYCGRVSTVGNALVVGYNSNKEFVGVVLYSTNNQYENNRTFFIPKGVSYIKAQGLYYPKIFVQSDVKETFQQFFNDLHVDDLDVINRDNMSNELISTSGSITLNSNVVTSDYIDVKENEVYLYSGRLNGYNGCVFAYDEDKKFMFPLMQMIDGGKKDKEAFVIPHNVYYIRVQSLIKDGLYLYSAKKTKNRISEISNLLEDQLYIKDVNLLEGASFTNQWIDSIGRMAQNANAYLSEYIPVVARDSFFYTGRMSGRNPLVVGFDADKNYWGNVLRANNGVYEEAALFLIPDGVSFVRVQSVDSQPQLSVKNSVKNIVTRMNEGSSDTNEANIFPQIVQSYINKKNYTDGIRILCFGSSFFMNTWWYLKDLFREAGINATIYGFYTGGAKFQNWVDRYESNEEVDCWISENGANYVRKDIKFRDTLEDGWDIIAFQQGAYQARKWDEYESTWSKLVSYVRRSCRYNTIIAYNCAWSPSINGNLEPYKNTLEGQIQWQRDANECFKRFLSLSGLNVTAIPNGATIWSVRNTAELTDETDLSGDALHINNGLPMYATAATMWETLIAPMFDISVDSIDWIPDETTQRCAINNFYTPITAYQRDIIRKIVRLSASNRFGFNTLNV